MANSELTGTSAAASAEVDGVALNEQEVRLIRWFRRNRRDGRHFMGIVRLVEGRILQLFDTTAAGRVD